jgi:hypothetical protein
MQDTLTKIDAYNSAVAIHETFGHLDPKRNMIHKGWFMFTYTAWGQTEPIDYDFKGLDSSPLIYSTLEEYMDSCWKNKRIEEGKVYRVEGQLRRFKNGNARISGKLVEVKLG